MARINMSIVYSHIYVFTQDNIDYQRIIRYNVKNHKKGVDCMQEQEPLTVEEVARQLRVSAETVRMWIRKGELGALDVGKYLIYPADLEVFKDRRRTGRKRSAENKEQ
jgi:excisionase family DNA binding protein